MSAGCSASPSIPAFGDERLRLRLLHGDDPGDAQPREPLHRERRRRGGRKRDGAPRPRQPLERDEPQRRSPPFRDGREALRGRRRERNSVQRANAGEPARQASPHQLRTAASRPTTLSTRARAGKNRAIWAMGLRNPFTFGDSAGNGPDLHRRRGQTPSGKRSTTVRRGRTTAGRRPKGRPRIPAIETPIYTYPSTRHRRCARSRAGPSTTPRPLSSQRLRRRLLLRRLLRRMDPAAGCGGLLYGRFHLRERVLVSPVDLDVGSRRNSLLPDPRRGHEHRRRVRDPVHAEHRSDDHRVRRRARSSPSESP